MQVLLHHHIPVHRRTLLDKDVQTSKSPELGISCSRSLKTPRNRKIPAAWPRRRQRCSFVYYLHGWIHRIRHSGYSSLRQKALLPRWMHQKLAWKEQRMPSLQKANHRGRSQKAKERNAKRCCKKLTLNKCIKFVILLTLITSQSQPKSAFADQFTYQSFQAHALLNSNSVYCFLPFLRPQQLLLHPFILFISFPYQPTYHIRTHASCYQVYQLKLS